MQYLTTVDAGTMRKIGLNVSVQPGLTLAKVPKLVLSPGDSAYELIKRAAGDDEALIVSDGAGGMLFTRSGTARAASLVEGQNILTASVDYDGADRYYRYVVVTQIAGTDEASGYEATRIQAEALDLAGKVRVSVAESDLSITTS